MTGRAQPPAARDATIVTLTMNPALDITTDTDVVVPTDKMRCGQARYDPGGGGITVARVAQLLGTSVSAVFPAGGPTGDLITDLVDYSARTGKLGASMTIHGAIMVIAGIGFGLAVIRASVLPRWTGVALAGGVVAVAATQAAPKGCN